MHESIKRHMEHNYCVSIYAVDDSNIILTAPENFLAGLGKLELHLVLKPDHVKIVDGIKEHKFDIDRTGQSALINIITGIIQGGREMSSSLFAIFNSDNEYIGSNLYELLKLNDKEVKYNSQLALAWAYKLSPPNEELIQNYNSITKAIKEILLC